MGAGAAATGEAAVDGAGTWAGAGAGGRGWGRGLGRGLGRERAVVDGNGPRMTGMMTWIATQGGCMGGLSENDNV